MRRAVVVVAVVALAAALGAAPAEAGKRRRKKPPPPVVRTIEVPYDNPTFGVGGGGGLCTGCPMVGTDTTETFAMVEIDDDFGSGYVRLRADVDGDGTSDWTEVVCGQTAEPIAVNPGLSMTVFPYAVGIECPGGSSVSGMVKFRFSSSAEALASSG